MERQPLLGHILREARLAQRLTLSEIADRIGISRTQLSRLEKGRLRRPPIHALMAIALHYDVPYEKLTALGEWTPLEKKAITPAYNAQNYPQLPVDSSKPAE